MGKAQRKMKHRLWRRQYGTQNTGQGNNQVQFGEQGKLMLHKPGSQNRKK